jgi:hypothetical protein
MVMKQKRIAMTVKFGIRNIRTIFPFFILKNKEALSIDNVKKLYTKLRFIKFEDSSLEIIRLAAQNAISANR